MPLKVGTLFPSLEGVTVWINGQFQDRDAIGSATLVQFWALSCPICKMNMPKLYSLIDAYRDHGLRLVSIHMPRMESDMNIEKVEAVVAELNLIGPCALDNEHIIGERFQMDGSWPSYYLFDAEGKLRSRAAGAMGLKMAENSLKRLLELEDKLCVVPSH